MNSYLVFDIGGTYTKYFFVDRIGNINLSGKFKTPKAQINELVNLMYKTIDDNSKFNLKGISICCPGLVDSEVGVVTYGGNVGVLHGINLKQIFLNKYNIPVSIENDGKAAALSEISKNKKESIVVLVLGTGIGGGIIINGQLLKGKNFSAGEVSYMVESIDDKEKQINLYGYEASAPKMISEIKRLNNLATEVSSEQVFEVIKPENKESWTIFINYCKYISSMIISLQHILDPDKFIIGGGISEQSIIIQQIKRQILKFEMWDHPKFLTFPEITQSKHGSNANYLGALHHLITEYKL